MTATLIQPSFSKGEITPEVFGRVDASSYKIGLATARNCIVRTYGNIVNRPGLQFIGLAYSQVHQSRLRRFKFNSGDVYMMEFADLALRFILNDAYVLEAAQPINGIGVANPMIVEVLNHGWSASNDIELANVGGVPTLNGRRLKVLNVIDANNVTVFDEVAGGPVNGVFFPPFTGGGTASRVYTIPTPYAAADLPLLKFTQSADVVTITHPNYPEARLARTAPTNWTLTTPTFAPAVATPTGVAVVANTTGAVVASYVVTAIDATTGEESLASAPVTITNSNVTSNNTITWTAGTNISLYSVYKAVNGVYGFVGDTPATAFQEINLAPALGTTPPISENPFVGVGNYPGCSSYYQQRQVRGGSLFGPDTAYYSQIGNFYNMGHSVPSNPGDAITASMVSQQVNQIRFFVPGKDLLVFTQGAEWRVNSGGQGFAADTISQIPQSSWGTSNLEPIVIGLTVLFVPNNQIQVRSFSYTYLSDNYTGNDLTLLSGHLFGQSVNGVPQVLTSWGFGLTPDPVVFGVRSDGTATAMTFQEDQQVTAWTRWDTQGLFECVDVVRPGLSTPDDVAYFCVTRVVGNGTTVRMIERMHSRRFSDVRDCFFVDGGLSYDNPKAINLVGITGAAVVQAPAHGFNNGDLVDIYDINWVPTFDDMDNEVQADQLNTRRYIVSAATADLFIPLNLDDSAVDITGWAEYSHGGTLRKPVTVVTGLYHLEGMAVVALADGNVVQNLTVVNGSVTIPYLASRVHVGLKYISDIQTLPIEAPGGPNTIQGKWKRIPNVTVRFNQSRGLFAGPDNMNLIELKQRQFEAYGDPTALLTGDAVVTIPSQWGDTGQIFLRQRYPLPMDILDIIPELDVQD